MGNHSTAGYDKKPIYTNIIQSANIVLTDFTTAEKTIDGYTKIWYIVADATHTLSVPILWSKTNNIDFYNGIINLITAKNVNGTIFYKIENSTINGADTTAPNIYIAATSYNGNTIDIIFNEPITGTPTITPTGFTVSSYSLLNNILRIVPSSTVINGATLSFNLSGITDIIGNVMTPVTGYSITNYTVNNLTAIRGQNGGVSGVLTSTASKFQLSTGAGGTDTPVSIVARIKLSSTGTQYSLVVVGAYSIGVQNTGQLFINSTNSPNIIYKQTTTTITVGVTYFVVFTYDGSKSISGLSLTINNVVDAGSGTLFGTYTGGNTNNNCIILNNINNPHYIDEVMIIKRVLNSTEKTEIYNSNIVLDFRNTTTWTSAPNDVIYYNKFDQGGTGNTDLSPSPSSITGTPNYVNPL